MGCRNYLKARTGGGGLMNQRPPLIVKVGRVSWGQHCKVKEFRKAGCASKKEILKAREQMIPHDEKCASREGDQPG